MTRQITPTAPPSARKEDAAASSSQHERFRRGDIRSARPYFLQRRPLVSFARRFASVAALLVLDLSGLALGLYGALTIREFYVGHSQPLWGLLWEAEENWLPFLALITALVFGQQGLYAPRERRAGSSRVLPALVLVALLTLAFAVGTGHDFSTFGLIPTAVVLSALCIGLFRASYETLAAALLHAAGARRRVVLIGHGPELERLREALGFSRGGIEYAFAGAVSEQPLGGDLPRLGNLEDLARVLRQQRVDEAIVADVDLSETQLLEIVEEAHRHGVRVRVAPKTTDLLAQRAEYVPGQGVPLFELRPPALAGADWAVKRLFDVVVSATILVAGLPLWLVVAGLVKATSAGPVFYRDRRIGVDEQPFAMLKFRTMYADAAAQQSRLEGANEADGPLFKLRDDPRVTPVGAFLRRFSLDEIPQVLNVLRREMSLVGPRPLPLRDYERLEEWHRKRYLVLPGMTGLWQISGRSNLAFDDLVRLDFYYLETWSVWLDISILLKTIPAVLMRRGAY